MSVPGVDAAAAITAAITDANCQHEWQREEKGILCARCSTVCAWNDLISYIHAYGKQWFSEQYGNVLCGEVERRAWEALRLRAGEFWRKQLEQQPRRDQLRPITPSPEAAKSAREEAARAEDRRRAKAAKAKERCAKKAAQKAAWARELEEFKRLNGCA